MKYDENRTLKNKLIIFNKIKNNKVAYKYFQSYTLNCKSYFSTRNKIRISIYNGNSIFQFKCIKSILGKYLNNIQYYSEYYEFSYQTKKKCTSDENINERAVIQLSLYTALKI